MFENVDGRTDGRTTDGRTDDGVTGILLAHPWAFRSDELKIENMKLFTYRLPWQPNHQIVSYFTKKSIFKANHLPLTKDQIDYFVCLFVALRPKSTAMVIAGRSVHLTTLFSWASLNKQLTSNRGHTFACNWQQPFMNDSAEGRRMTIEIISWSISTKVWDRAGIELATPGSAVSFASVTRHVTDCAMRPGI